MKSLFQQSLLKNGLAKMLLAVLLGMVVVGYAWPQMDHSAHMMMGAGKPANCDGSGMECANAATPFLTNDGKLYLVWTAGGMVSVAKSDDLGKMFSAPIKIAEHGKTLDTGGDARPQILVQGDRIFITYAFFKDARWNAQINKAYSDDGGKTFSTPISIVNDTSSQRFPVMLLQPNGKLFLSWIDKRIVASSKNTANEMLGGSIAYAFSDDGGVHFSQEKIANKDSCECCRIGVSLDPKGGLAFTYRAIFPGGIRDHASQYISNTEKLGPIRRVSNDNWKTDVCPHQGPSISISSAGTFHVAWFTSSAKRQGVFYANSHNEGATYSDPVRVGKDDANASRPYLLAAGSNVWLVWKEFDGHKTIVYMRNSLDDGKTWSESNALAETSAYSDHPLLIHRDKQVFLSWLTREEGYRLIKAGNAK